MDELRRYLEEHSALFIAIGAAVSAVCALVGLWFQWKRLKKDRNRLSTQVSQLQFELGERSAHEKHLELQCASAENQAVAVRADLKANQDAAQQKETQLTEQLESAKDEIGRLRAGDDRTARQIKRMLKLEGQLWQERVPARAPGFRPLAERKTPIISVVNLKGGVGKTTITAHLGAALAERGYRPLLLDIDLQGSLSTMFELALDVKKSADEERLLQHFLNQSVQKRALNILQFVTPIMEDRAGLVATSDRMAYAELNLTMHWLLRLGRRDTRFLLRRALHQKRVTNRYDIILLDCPPLINTCCVNALAASDYVLIPVLPSTKASERVPQLLKTLKDLGARINPQIQPLGILLNRTQAHDLNSIEKRIWHQLQQQCLDVWGSPVPACQTHIRNTVEVRNSEGQFAVPAHDSELHDTFRKLILELEERLPSECRRAATTSK
jgi:cellulose biosynthesis protein BcsQ